MRSLEYKQRQREAQRLRRLSNPEKYKEMGRKSERNRRMKRYGITEEQYKTLFTGFCAICSSILNGGRDTHIDHCHVSGKVRGILCRHCNLGLGHFKDNKELMKKAMEYLN